MVDGDLASHETAEEVGPHARHVVEWPEIARIAVVTLAAGAVWLHLWEPFPRLSVVGLVATLVGGYAILKEAVENLLARRMTMELSMTIALGAALAIGEFFTALVITLFVLVAEILEGLTVSRGRRAIKDLLDFLPRTASVRRGTELGEVPLDAVRVGDVVLVSPGGLLPVDGTVIAGHSYVDEATITGESMPVEKLEGRRVYAGTINHSGALEVRAEQLGHDTSFGKIVEAVERAEHSRAPVQKTADRLAGYLVYFAIGAAVVTFAITRDARSTISVIIVAGACGIAAGTPLAILGAIGRAARLGSIVKGGLHLETLAAVDTVVFDKTGTLTYGKPEVRDVVAAAGSSPTEVLAVAATAELRSEHPLGKAIVGRAAEIGLGIVEPKDFASASGKGVIASLGDEEILVGNRALLGERGVDFAEVSASDSSASQVLVASGGRFLGSIQVADAVRPGAREAVAALGELGMKTMLLTGDQQTLAAAVAREFGIDEMAGDLLPEDKARVVTSLVASGRTVAMVGDGVNDAPALAAASVGIAMGSGTDVARESADVVLLGNDLVKLVETIRIAKRARRIIMQNFAGTLIVDGAGIALAALGLLNPLLAAFIHVASEMAFILNSARLLAAKPPAAHGRAPALATEAT